MRSPCGIAPYTTVLTGASTGRKYHTVLYGGCAMRDLLLQCSGAAAILVALIHGVLGETKVFARATIEPPRLRTLIRLVWQAGTVAWIGGGGVFFGPPVIGTGNPGGWVGGAPALGFWFGGLAHPPPYAR